MNKIKQIREKLGYTQEDLLMHLKNKGLKISFNTLRRFETEQSIPDVFQAKAIADFLNTDIESLFFN